jgi:serine/threonine protein kinase
MSEKEKQHIVSEVNILRELKHPNIVRYYDRIIDKKNTKIYIIMEYCEGGDIGALIKRCKKNKEFIAEDVIWKIFTQLVLALHECHTNKGGKIMHRDLKPSNVFLDSENNVKLGDFGLSRMLSNESNFAYSQVGTPYYMSPEQIEENRYNEKSDIWSLGCFLFELATLNPPFEASNHLSLALKIKSGKVERIGSRYSEELSRIIMWMMYIDPEKRPSCEELLNIPQVSLRLRERRLKENMAKLKKYEDSLASREKEIIEKEKDIETRIRALIEKEEKLVEWEKKLSEKDKNKETSTPSHKRNSSNEKNSNNYINVNVNLSKYDDLFSQRLKVIDNSYNYEQEYNTINSHNFIPKRPELNDTNSSFNRFDPSLYKNDEKSSSIKSNIYKNIQSTRGTSYSRLTTPQNKQQENSDIYTKYTTLKERISSTPNIKHPNINKNKTLTLSNK